MKTFSLSLLFAAVATAASERDAKTVSAQAHVPTVWLAGDSTTAPDGGHNGTQGWGEYLHYSLGNNAFVNNSAYAGRSARSFTREGRFDAIAKALHPGDWVVIEFGINDGGAPTNLTGDKGRADCPGAGSEECWTVYK
jgi:rhamnogalacturonan acetylesterase